MAGQYRKRQEKLGSEWNAVDCLIPITIQDLDEILNLQGQASMVYRTVCINCSHTWTNYRPIAEEKNDAGEEEETT